MAKYEWSEVFMSIEGEGPYSGHPTVYVRFTKCNFTCKGFNNPNKVDTLSTGLGFDPAYYAKLEDIPTVTVGCDSIYAWDDRFAHMWHRGDENALGEAVKAILPHQSWAHPVTKQPVILSLTGGEPTLRAKFLPTLLNSAHFKECKHILVETNCSVPLKWDFVGALNEWLCADPTRMLTWSNSPKLSASGEKWDDAIVPKIASMQRTVTGREQAVGPYGHGQAEQYFKFVCGPRDRDFDEVARAMEVYFAEGCVPRTTPVYIMPEACIEEQQQEIASAVAKMCIDRGYKYCHRIQNSVFGNGVGT
jgi:organic radical activating enzyme